MELAVFGLLLLEAWVAVVVLTSTACVILYVTVASIFGSVMADPAVQTIVKAARGFTGKGGGDWKTAAVQGGLSLAKDFFGGRE